MWWLNLAIYALTLALCIGIVWTMSMWCYYIDEKKTSFAFWFLFGVAGVKFSLGGLAISNILAVLIDGAQPPLWTLPFRVLLLLFIAFHFVIVQIVRPSDVTKLERKN